MIKFSPYSWSFEAIDAVSGNKGLFRDVKEALKKIYTYLLTFANENTMAKGSGITRILQKSFRSDASRTKLMQPVSDAIYKHTNLKMDTVKFVIDKEINAYFGEDDVILFVFLGDPFYGKWIREDLFNDASSFDEVLSFVADTHKLSHALDRKTNKARSTHALHGSLVLNSGFFDMMHGDPEEMSTMLASVMLHELGHCFDSYDNAIRMTSASELGEDILKYTDREITPEEGEKMLLALRSGLLGVEMSSNLKKKYLTAIKELLKDPEKDEDWIATATALFSIGIRYIESNIGGGGLFTANHVSDTILSDDAYRGAERRADKFSANAGGSDGIIMFCDMLTDAARLSKATGEPKWYIENYLANVWNYLRDNHATYDTYANRAEAVLKQKYLIMKTAIDDPQELKLQLESIKIAEDVVKKLHKIEEDYLNSAKFLDAVRRTLGRGLFFFISRNRLDQNSLLMNTIRRVANSQLHSHAERLRLGLSE